MKIKSPWSSEISLFDYSHSFIQSDFFDTLVEDIKDICQLNGVDYHNGRDLHITRLDAKMLSIGALSTPHKTFLDIGTNMGLSACILASIPGSHVITLEKNSEHAKLAKELFKRHSHLNIELIEGDAHENLASLNETFGLVFIDAEKKGYQRYFEWSHNHLNTGGWILVDNVFALGTVTTPEKEIPKQLRSITKFLNLFNQNVLTHPDYESFILPTQEGLLIALKK